MKEKKHYNNNQHLYGFLNGVRMNDAGEGRTAINMQVVTLENYKKDGQSVTNRTYHDAVLFTGNKELIKKFEGIAADLEANKDAEKKTTHTVSLDGILKSKDRDLQVIVREDSLAVDTKQAENEVRNRAELSGNIASVTLHEEQNFASVLVVNHFRPKDSDKEFETTVNINVSGDRKFSKETYEALKKGEMGVGDFIRVSGQMHNNNYTKGETKVYGMVLDANSTELLYKKGEKVAEKAEQKVEKKPEKKPAKAAAETKTKKPAVSRKKGQQSL